MRGRCADAGIVDDVVQETFLAVWRGTARHREEGYSGDAAGWLWRIAARRLVDAVRGDGARGRLRQALSRLRHRDEASAEERALAGVEHGDFAGALTRLSPELRAVLQATVIASGEDAPAFTPGSRPAGWHALYVTAVCLVLACAALLRAGGRTRAVKAATALALAAVAVGAIGQSSQDTAGLAAARTTATDAPQKVQSCTTHDGSRYCAFPEWSGVRSGWAGVVERVRSLTGGEAARTPLTVRQHIDTTYGVEADAALTPSTVPGQVTVGTRWGGNRVPEFAVGVATVLVAGAEAATEREMCHDARPITIMWLVLGADPTPSDTFRRVRLNDTTEGSGLVLAPTNSLSMTAAQTTVVRELLARPRAEVTARVKAHWAELTSTTTSPAEAAKLLGVAAPQETEAQSCEE
jgi:hypothetical protein